MNNYLIDRAAMDTPWIDGPFAKRLLQDMMENFVKRSPKPHQESYVYQTLYYAGQMTKYIEDGYLLVDLELSNNFLTRLIAKMRAAAEDQNTAKQDGIYEYSESPRLFELWKTVPEALELARNERILFTLDMLYGKKAIPFQTINFMKGSNQPLHQDCIHFYTEPQRWMVGVWVALEDITMENGPLQVVPGSHTWPFYDFQSLNLPKAEYGKQEDNYREYENFIKQLVEAKKAPVKPIPVSRGTAIIWASNLLHGGSPILNPELTRFSQATHYYFEGCQHYYSPMFSDIRKGEYAEKNLTEKDILNHKTK